MNTPPRKFEDIAATREQVPLLVGLVGPSGSGKTFSALRLAAGIQQVTGGDVYGIDTESRRMLHYADTFKFRHLQFQAPFSPLDYLAAIEHCVAKGARTIIIDSMSHEHEGPGGVLEMHEELMGGDFKKQFIAWAKPKAMRRRLINSMLQFNCNFIMAYRAKEKLKVIRGKEPEPRGWQPIAGEEYVYEATLNCLLLPGSNGVPCWNPEHDNEGMIKLPSQFRGIFEKGPQLSEEIGVKLAEWGKGGAAAPRKDGVTADQLKSLRAAWMTWAKVPAPTNDEEKEMARAAFVSWVDGVLGKEAADRAQGNWMKTVAWTAEQMEKCKTRLSDPVQQAAGEQSDAPPDVDASTGEVVPQNDAQGQQEAPGEAGQPIKEPPAGSFVTHEKFLEQMIGVAMDREIPETVLMPLIDVAIPPGKRSKAMPAERRKVWLDFVNGAAPFN